LLVAADLQKLLHLFAQERQHLDYAVRDLVARQSDIRTSGEGFELAKIHCVLHAATACYYMWAFNRLHLDQAFASGEWLVLCLARLLKTISPQKTVVLSHAYDDHALTIMKQLLQENRLFAIIPMQLASS